MYDIISQQQKPPFFFYLVFLSLLERNQRKRRAKNVHRFVLFWFLFWWSQFFEVAMLRIQRNTCSHTECSVRTERAAKKREKKGVVCRPSVGAFHGRNDYSLFFFFAFLRAFWRVCSPTFAGEKKNECDSSHHCFSFYFYFSAFPFPFSPSPVILSFSHAKKDSRRYFVVASLSAFLWYCSHTFGLCLPISVVEKEENKQSVNEIVQQKPLN